MNKKQAVVVAGMLMLMANFVFPMFLNFEVGFDLPLIGHITLWKPLEGFGAYSFVVGGVIALAFMYLMLGGKQSEQ